LLGISWAGQLPVQTSGGAEAAAELAALELAEAGRMAAVTRAARASTILFLALALAGCGDKPDSGEATDEVFQGVVGRGTTQDVHCDDVGVEVRGKPVVACSFEEERNESGVMRAVDRCFVMSEGVLIDVTREVPVGTSCAVTSP
jgi:hypothetical protein